jgi:hypothetical protein
MNTLRETSAVQSKELVKGTTKTGEVISLRFPFLWADKASANGRIYPAAELKKAVQELQSVLEKSGTVYGSTQHLEKIEVEDVSHMLSSVEYIDGAAIATVNLVPTHRGKDLHAIIVHGGQLGVSARGSGVVGADGRVKDYHIAGVDFVLDAAFDDAHVSAANRIYESRELDEEKLAALKERFRVAQNAGYRGTFTQYRRIINV